jgi:hypothetical protein
VNAIRRVPLGVSGKHPRWFCPGLAAVLLTILDAAVCVAPLTAQGTAHRSWATVSTPDGVLRLQLPPDYRRRNDYGCWTREGREYYGRGYRDLCVQIEQSETVSRLHLQDILGTHLSVNGACAADCTTYEHVRVDTISIAGRRVVAERGLASGGFTGMVRQRTLLVIIPFADGRSAVLRGETGEDAGYDELLSIAGTVRESARP